MSQISAAPPTNDVDIPSDEEPISGTPPNIDEDIRHTPHNRRIANYHNYSMGAVDISKLRDALVQETRGQYIGGVDPDVFVKTFMGWNDETSNSFRLKQPSKTKVSCLVGMADKPESGMNKDWGTWQFMSAILTQHPNKASHTVVDDRESALHVLTYMALKHLSHNSTDEQALEGKLRMFNDYIARVGKPDIASDYKASIIVQGGPRVKFDIRAITLLIQDLSGFFAPRYIDKYDRTAGELEIMSEAARDRYKTEKDQHQQKLQQLQDPASDFVYKTMRSWAAMMPEPPDNVTQWVDNMQGHDGLLKRPGDHLASAREKMSLRCDGRVSFKSSDTRPTSLD
ncbi:hypothetical protein EYR38_001950 [Pleurotus pulmonarius]|nr:hypothetical protein EYR38_001950 [Pleurotus pulmonarius]